MKNRLIGTMTASVVAASAVVFGMSAPALAASRSDACSSWACGSATLTFTSARAINPISMSVRDTACNQHIAYVRLRVHYADGTSAYTKKRAAYSTCGAGYKTYNGLSFSAGKSIRGVEAYVGDDLNGQKTGTYVDNPRHP